MTPHKPYIHLELLIFIFQLDIIHPCTARSARIASENKQFPDWTIYSFIKMYYDNLYHTLTSHRSAISLLWNLPGSKSAGPCHKNSLCNRRFATSKPWQTADQAGKIRCDHLNSGFNPEGYLSWSYAVGLVSMLFRLCGLYHIQNKREWIRSKKL